MIPFLIWVRMLLGVLPPVVLFENVTQFPLELIVDLFGKFMSLTMWSSTQLCSDDRFGESDVMSCLLLSTTGADGVLSPGWFACSVLSVCFRDAWCKLSQFKMLRR